MKNYQSKFLLILAVASLVIIFLVVAIGTLGGRYTFWLKKGNGSMVLGIANKLTRQPEQLENLLETTVESTKEGLSQKLKETEGKVKSTLEKEITNFTSSQIEAIKLKICQDWGVVKKATASSTP